MRRPPSHGPQATTQRFHMPERIFGTTFLEIHEHVDRGAIVHVIRVDGAGFQIFKNGFRLIVRVGSTVIGTVDAVWQAVAVADAHFDTHPEDGPQAVIDRLIRKWQQIEAERGCPAPQVRPSKPSLSIVAVD